MTCSSTMSGKDPKQPVIVKANPNIRIGLRRALPLLKVEHTPLRSPGSRKRMELIAVVHRFDVDAYRNAIVNLVDFNRGKMALAKSTEILGDDRVIISAHFLLQHACFCSGEGDIGRPWVSRKINISASIARIRSKPTFVETNASLASVAPVNVTL